MLVVDCHLGRRDYFGRIMRSYHRVNWKGGRGGVGRRDKRIENIPLKTAMVSSRGSGNTLLHQKPTAAASECKVHLLPWYPAQAAPFMSVKTGAGGRLTICSSRLQLEPEQTCSLHVCIPSSQDFRMLYRGASHDMNHLVASAELEMSRLIRARRYCTIYITGNAVKRGDFIKERSGGSGCKQTFIALGNRCTFSRQNHLQHCCTAGDQVCCTSVRAESLDSFNNRTRGSQISYS